MNNELQAQSREMNPEIMNPDKGLPVFEPPVDIHETADEYIVIADMPGLKPDDIDVKLERELLSVEGKSEIEGLQALLYRRDFRVVNGLDPAAIRAEYKLGTLEVHLPKPATLKPRRITVSAG